MNSKQNLTKTISHRQYLVALFVQFEKENFIQFKPSLETLNLNWILKMMSVDNKMSTVLVYPKTKQGISTTNNLSYWK